MDLPTTRELELEILLREKEEQVTELGDEVTRLRQYLASQPGPSTADPVTLPPPLVSLLLPHLNQSGGASTMSNSTSAALAQRVQLLQEENDELYDILKQGETGRLKEEVQGLLRIVSKLEGALRESHQVIMSLSTELDKSYEAFNATASSRQTSNSKPYSRSPRNSYHNQNNSGSNTGTGSSSSSRLPPTGPRAHKKPRLSESQTSPSLRSNASLPSHSNSHRSRSNSSRNNDRSPRTSPGARGGKSNSVKMEVDEDSRTRPRSPEQNKERRGNDRGARESDRDRERGRERERDHDGNRSRRNGNANYPRTASGRAGGGGGASSRRPTDRGPPLSTSAPSSAESPHSGGSGGERTLVERLGLGQ